MRAARVTAVVPCVSVCSFLPPRASRPRNNIGTYVFIATRKKTFIIVIFAKNASFRSYGVICLPPMPPTTLKSQTTDTRNQLKVGKPLIVAILTGKTPASFRSYDTFCLPPSCAYPQYKYAYILYRYMRVGVFPHTHNYNYYAWAECASVAK